VTRAEPSDRPEVRRLPGCEPAERDVLDALALDLSRAPDAGDVTEQQQPDHQPRVIGRRALELLVRGVYPAHVQVLFHELGDEPGQVPRGQPVVQRRRQKQHLVRRERPERLVPPRPERLGRRRRLRRHPRPQRLLVEQNAIVNSQHD
jgi:hypothetical protein